MFQILYDNIGVPGRMMSGNKRGPKGHICYWNANIIVEGKKVWYGDLDMTADKKSLQKIANEIGKPLYILTEHMARFDNELNPKVDEAVAIIQPE